MSDSSWVNICLAAGIVPARCLKLAGASPARVPSRVPCSWKQKQRQLWLLLQPGSQDWHREGPSLLRLVSDPSISILGLGNLPPFLSACAGEDCPQQCPSPWKYLRSFFIIFILSKGCFSCCFAFWAASWSVLWMRVWSCRSGLGLCAPQTSQRERGHARGMGLLLYFLSLVSEILGNWGFCQVLW